MHNNVNHKNDKFSARLSVVEVRKKYDSFFVLAPTSFDLNRYHPGDDMEDLNIELIFPR
jgi:hypothetical protein